MGFKPQPAYTDILGLTVKFLADEIAFGSIDDGTSQADVGSHPVRLPALDGDPSTKQFCNDASFAGLENLGLPEVGNGLFIPVFDPNLGPLSKRERPDRSGKFHADFVGRALGHESRDLSLGFHMDGYG